MRAEPRQRANGKRQDGRASAFSLVELLVVLGIIAILISLLMPALRNVREQAKEVQCQVNLRTMYTAVVIHMNDHQGYLPVGGWHWEPAGGVVNPQGLNDAQARHYIYYNDGGIQRPVPLTVALTMSLGRKVRLDSRQALEADMESPQLRKHFQCPNQEEQLRGLTQKSSEPWEAPRDWSSYVFNEAILGLRERKITTDPTLGKLTRIKHPGMVFLSMDGRPRDQGKDNWLMVPDKGPQDTLWDFQVMVTASPAVYGKQLLDFLRHRYRANVVFMDGHVESVPMTADGLATVGVSKGIQE